MTTWTHNGVTITLNSSGRFVAEVPSGKLSSTSLTGVKKMIEKKGGFLAFRAFVFGYRQDSVRDVTVIGTKSDGRKYSPRMLWVTESGETYYEVIRDTPENREAAVKLLTLQKRLYQEREEADQLIRKTRAAIPASKADDAK